MQDMDAVLSWQLKKEIADRYFGFRKRIEEDQAAYEEQLTEALKELEEGAGLQLKRIGLLLVDAEILQRFQQLVGIQDIYALTPLTAQPPALREELFAPLACRGFTRRARFHHLLFDLYAQLTACLERYQRLRQELIEEQETIAAEIELFYRQNDLSMIMGFMRGLGDSDQGLLGVMPDLQHDRQMEEKMRIVAPKEARVILPQLPSLPPLASCKFELLDLAEQAYRRQNEPDLRDVCRG